MSTSRLSSGLGESPPSALAASPALGAGAAEAWPVLELCCLGRSDWLRVDKGLELGQEHPSPGFILEPLRQRSSLCPGALNSWMGQYFREKWDEKIENLMTAFDRLNPAGSEPRSTMKFHLGS